MSKKRILHISTPTSWRGGEQQLAYLLEELRSVCDNLVLCTEGSEMESHCKGKGYRVFTAKKRFSLDPGFASMINTVCQEENIDLIHTHDSHAHSLSIIAAQLFGTKVPLIVSRRVDFPIEKSWFSQYKYNHSLVKKILCVSDEIKEITSMGVKDPSVLKTVYSGIDTQKFSARTGKLRKELSIADDVFLVGNTSALADHKDYPTFVDTAKRVLQTEENILFLIIGMGPKESEISSYIRVNELEDKIKMIGFRKDVPEILADLDLFMITSKTEGLGTSILDAFAAGVPVLATRAGGIPELIVHEESGLLSEVGESEELAQELIRIKKDPGLRKQLVDKAKERVKEFSKSKTAEKTFASYLEVLN